MMEPQQHKDFRTKAREELYALLYITLYFTLFLGAFNTYRRLILRESGLSYLHYGITVVEALILAKIILIGDAMNLGRRQDRRPLVVSTVWKSILFAALAYLFTILERVIEGLIHRLDWAEILRKIIEPGPYEFLANMIMMMAAFVPFFALWGLRRVLGPSKFSEIWLSGQVPSSPGGEPP